MNQSSYIARKRKEQNLTQEQLERQKGILYGVPSSPSIFPAAPCRRQPGDTDVRDSISGILIGLSIAEILAGIGIVGKKLLKQ